MYNGIGLQTARGSGTNGYVMRNLAFVRPKMKRIAPSDMDAKPPEIKKANPAILEHERLRRIEARVFTYSETLRSHA